MIKAKKSLSQNFLIDKNICNKIIDNTNIKDKIVLEVGPGYGILTDIILQKNPKKIFLIEKDNKLVRYLNNKYKNNSKIIIIHNDILKYNFIYFKDIIIISNLPYNISTKIILYLFKFHKNILEMIFMIQKDVAIKFNYNLKNMNKYKFLTRIVSNYKICFDVSPKVFLPKPKVTSSVVKFKFKEKIYDLEKAIYFSKLIFKNVRKKINNNIQIKVPSKIMNKRVNELSIDDLLFIYNNF